MTTFVWWFTKIICHSDSKDAVIYAFKNYKRLTWKDWNMNDLEEMLYNNKPSLLEAFNLICDKIYKISKTKEQKEYSINFFEDMIETNIFNQEQIIIMKKNINRLYSWSKLFKDLKIDYDNVEYFYENETTYEIKIKWEDRLRIYNKDTLKEMFTEIWEIKHFIEDENIYKIKLKWGLYKIYDKKTKEDIFTDIWEIRYFYEYNKIYEIRLKWEDRCRMYNKETMKEIK